MDLGIGVLGHEIGHQRGRIPREFEGPGWEGSSGLRVTFREMTVWDEGEVVGGR